MKTHGPVFRPGGPSRRSAGRAGDALTAPLAAVENKSIDLHPPGVKSKKTGAARVPVCLCRRWELMPVEQQLLGFLGVGRLVVHDVLKLDDEALVAVLVGLLGTLGVIRDGLALGDQDGL